MESTSIHGVVGRRGFTLVELIVVLAIISIITLVIITSQSSYNRSLILTNTAYSIALSIREAQTLGLSSRTFSNVQNAGYGVHFASALDTSYTIFSDIKRNVVLHSCPTGQAGMPEAKPGNCLYDDSDEAVVAYTLNQGFRITNFCGISTNLANTWFCKDTTSSSRRVSAIDIAFLRPNTEAIMTAVRASNNDKFPLQCVTIWVTSPTGDAQKCIHVSRVGQVSVMTACPSPTATTCP